MDPVTPTTSPANPEVPDPKRNSLDSNTIIVIFLLLFFYPVGVILMWLLMKHWQTWVKVLITLLFILPIIIGVLLALFLTALDPKSALEESRQVYPEISQVVTPTSAFTSTPSPINTTNWIEVINTSGSFTFKYPPEYSVYAGDCPGKCDETTNNLIDIFPNENMSYTSSRGRIHLMGKNDTTTYMNRTLKEIAEDGYIREVLPPRGTIAPSERNTLPKDIQEISLDGNLGYWYSVDSDSPSSFQIYDGEYTITYFEHKNNIFRIVFPNTNEYHAILSSMTFLD